jgi:AGZA family xanthine/uracil permease-like MFS transporter
MILAAITVYIIDRHFYQAALWSLGAALLSWVGLMHSYDWTMADTVIKLGWGAGNRWAVGYVLMALLFCYAGWATRHERKAL